MTLEDGPETLLSDEERAEYEAFEEKLAAALALDPLERINAYGKLVEKLTAELES
ncbi:MAG: GTPase [Rothia dentocariosa]|nr:GTPase [Rothia dentocariosa]